MSNRSGTTYSAPTDADRRPVMLGASTADGITPLPLEVDPATGQLQVSGGGGGGGGTQYTELATTSPATGNLTLGRYVTSLPTLTNGQLNEPMLDSSSRLLANIAVLPVATAGQASTLAIGGTAATNQFTSAATNPLLLAGSDYGGTPRVQNLKVDSSGLAYTNLASFGGNAVVTGTGASGVGIPRVTVSNDSTVTANAGTNLNTSALALDASITTLDTDVKSNITLHAGTNVIGHVITDTNSTTAVTQTTAANLNAAVVGTKTNNNVAPGATNLGVLPGVANAAVQTWTEGDQVLESMDLAGNQRATLGTLLAGEDLPNNVMKVEQRVTYTNLSASTNAVKSGAGRFFGFIVNSHTNGTLKFWDNTTGATTIILNTITFAAGPSMWVFPVAINFATGLSVTVGGTIDFTVLWN